MLADAQTTGQVIDQFAALYSKEERQSIRRGEALPAPAIDRTVRLVLQLAGQVFRQHPDANFTPAYDEVGNTFIFRAALAIYLLVLDWAANGGARDAAPARMRNDFVDMNLAAYATYFDGLLTADAKLRRLHSELRVWLVALFDCRLPGGLAPA
jgi:hypothetical protein